MLPLWCCSLLLSGLLSPDVFNRPGMPGDSVFGMSGSTSKRYTVELCERAVRMVGEIRAEHESRSDAMSKVGLSA